MRIRRIGVPLLIRSLENTEKVVFPLTFRSFSEANYSQWPSLPSLSWHLRRNPPKATSILRTTHVKRSKWSWERYCFFHWWSPFAFKWMRQQKWTCSTGLTSIPENCNKALWIYLKSECGVQLLQLGMLVPVFWRKSGHSNREFRPVCGHVKECFFHELDLGDICFQQDISRASMAVLKEQFLRLFILIRGNLAWPARFGPLRFFYFFNPMFLLRTIQDLKANIRVKTANTPVAMLVRVMTNPEIALFSVWTMGGVIYLIWFSKLCKTNFRYIPTLKK